MIPISATNLHRKIATIPISFFSYLLCLIVAPTTLLACADANFCAVVRNTTDGFVALRNSPSAESTAAMRLPPYDIVLIFYSDCHPNRITDPWSQVVCVPRVDGACNEKKSTRRDGLAPSSWSKQVVQQR